MIVIIDYGAGNLRSVVNAISHLGYKAKITANASDIPQAAAIILPGVGTAADAMKQLDKLELVEPLRQAITSGRPFLGICLGLQILFRSSEEGGGQDCLNVVAGTVKKLPPGLKIPHMGWNQVRQNITHPIFKGIPDGSNFYFVHSYFVQPEDNTVLAGETDYGISFCSMIVRDNLVAVQFHPEKSGEVGLRLYDNFLRLAKVGSK